MPDRCWVREQRKIRTAEGTPGLEEEIQALEQITPVDHGGPMLEQLDIPGGLQPVETMHTGAEEESVRRKKQQRGFCPDPWRSE